MSASAASRRLSLNEIRSRVANFVVNYGHLTSERQNTQDFWRALMRCYGIEDTYLNEVAFEFPARRADTGRWGRIDVFRPGKFLIEQKSAGRLVTKRGAPESNAEQQARAYLTGGTITEAMMPRYVVTSDFTKIQVTDLHPSQRNRPTRTRTIYTADLNEHVELLLFLTGHDDDEALIAEEQAEASVQAARLMGDLYTALTGDADSGIQCENADDEEERAMAASILMTRLLFLMFGDDAGLWERGLFQRFIDERTQPDGSDLGSQLSTLFRVLDTPEARRDRRMDEAFARFPYVNGAIFREDDARMMWFDRSMREALVTACRFDWSRISPAVFGSLFQTIKSKKARHSDGEHYTSEENILKVLRPMFLDGLRSRLEAANTKPALEALHEELRHMRYLDPACGCGNFLIVAYREMRALELDLLAKLRAKQGRDAELILDPSDLLNVRLDQFYGIEINWWPAKIAETAMFLVDHQANHRMARVLGYTPQSLPIDIAASIHHGNALTTDWNDLLPNTGDTVYVFGNPPFLGHKEKSKQQRLELLTAWNDATRKQAKGTGHLDFVTAWHAKSLSYLKDKRGEFAFVTTNSIAQGEPVSELFGPIQQAGWQCKFAHRTFPWISESAGRDTAAVHCVVVGFTRDQEVKPRLFDYASPQRKPTELQATSINGYLVDSPVAWVDKRSSPLSLELPVVNYGVIPADGGHLLVEPHEYEAIVADPVAARYLRPYVGAAELVNGKSRWCLWLNGDDFDAAAINQSPELRRRVAAVRESRQSSRAYQDLASTPHLFMDSGRRQPTVPYLCIPIVTSENRPFATAARLTPDVVASNATFTCPDTDGFAFAIISSSMFMTWQKTVGGRLKSDPRFSATLVWNTLPLPSVDLRLRRQIIAAGEEVLRARSSHADRSLAQHYHPLAMSKELVDAHRALDRLVDKAFGAGRGRMTDATRQTTLFARYAELTGQQIDSVNAVA